jgi:hypothetical protein
LNSILESSFPLFLFAAEGTVVAAAAVAARNPMAAWRQRQQGSGSAMVVRAPSEVEMAQGGGAVQSLHTISATAILRTSTNYHTEWFKTERRAGQRRHAIK